MVGWLGRLDTFASQCPESAHRCSLLSLSSSLSLARSHLSPSRSLYYVRVQGVACASIMALRPTGRGAKRRGEMRGRRKRERERERGGQRNKKCCSFRLAHGSPFVYADPLNLVHRISGPSALEEAFQATRCPAGSRARGTEVDALDYEITPNGEERFSGTVMEVFFFFFFFFLE